MTTAVLLAFAQVTFCAEVGADLKKTHEELMRNVVAINSEGLAGQVITVSRKAFQIGDAGNADVVAGIDFKPAEAAGYHRYVQDGGGHPVAGLGIVISSRFSSL